MAVFWELFLFTCFCLLSRIYSSEVNSTEPSEYTHENKTFKVELFPASPTYAGQTRRPRKFFQKIHSGAAFLTGLKLGAILSKKGFELGHGKVTSTHSFQLFGKAVNTATSLAYGDVNPLLPLADDVPNFPGVRSQLKKSDKKVFHVTVVESPSNKTLESLDEVKEEPATVKKSQDVVVLYQESEKDSNFIKDHNKMVSKFNENFVRPTPSFKDWGTY